MAPYGGGASYHSSLVLTTVVQGTTIYSSSENGTPIYLGYLSLGKSQEVSQSTSLDRPFSAPIQVILNPVSGYSLCSFSIDKIPFVSVVTTGETYYYLTSFFEL